MRTGAYQNAVVASAVAVVASAVVVAASAVVEDKVGNLDEDHNSAQALEGDHQASG